MPNIYAPCRICGQSGTCDSICRTSIFKVTLTKTFGGMTLDRIEALVTEVQPDSYVLDLVAEVRKLQSLVAKQQERADSLEKLRAEELRKIKEAPKDA